MRHRSTHKEQLAKLRSVADHSMKIKDREAYFAKRDQILCNCYATRTVSLICPVHGDRKT